ncbi:hypothetical protein [Pyrobaculum aerophilum]|uniref:hypothetical protein n=1 Tax=Pyrobaculum aerophilum TaxID=13773 RepID=UPI0023F2CFB3|nr:hypothetical protein [Pyrobaculum aerophilum]MCX8136667.1 hypothetical protein [Pyrobaculum aerophilum]
MSLRRGFAAGFLAGLIQMAYLYYFAAPLAESLHEQLATEPEEEYAQWAAVLTAGISGGLWGVLLAYISERLGILTGAMLSFTAFSLLPGLKWLPTPHGVSYVEPVWWREVVHGVYLLYNFIWLYLLALGRSSRFVIHSAALAVLGFAAFPSFTLPEKYIPYFPELRALQGLALTSWALFWGTVAAGLYLTSPIKRPWRL